MPEYLSEAIVLILDASRSMFRSDYSPNRLEACKEGVLTFIKSRINKDNEVGSKSAFSFVSINGAPKKNFSFFDDAKYEEFREALSSINCSGKSKIGDTIGMGIKILIEDIRTNGQRIPHIILFSDGMNTKSRIDPLKMANLAKQLGIKIDCVRIGDVEQFNILKQIATSTNGEFFYLNNISEIQRISNRLGGSNLQLIDPNEQSGKESISRKVLKKIASPLLSESEMNKGSKDQKNLIERLRGTKSYEKCSICFQPDDPISKSSFSISGGYCPNCAQPMHLSCASMWAKNQDKEGDGTVFRCVHCLYLLKIPASIQTKVRLHKNIKRELKKNKGIQKVKTYNVSIEIAGNLGESALYSACPVCNGIFEEDEHVIRCGNPNCNAIYHNSCFQKLKNNLCKSCGSKLVKLFN